VLKLEHVGQLVRSGEVERAVAGGSDAVVTHVLAQSLAEAGASSAPVRCPPAMPTLLPIYGVPSLKMP
jgi:hypothetical protein